MFMNNIRYFTGAVLTLGVLTLSASAEARPEPIPKPVAMPDIDESPGTGQDAPEDPEDPPLIEPPEGLDCVAGDDQSDCDPGHEGDDAGRRPGNEPSDEWYGDMALRMYVLQESLDDMSEWAEEHDPYVAYYVVWMKSVVQQYYSLGYDHSGKPREYSYGRMTRGDYNYYYYYWVRPIYLTMLHYSAYYYKSHRHSPDLYEYEEALAQVAGSYHMLVLCNYGFNGEDEDAREDLRVQLAEQNAGFDR